MVIITVFIKIKIIKMNTLKKVFGVLIIIADVMLLFLSPFIWNWYWKFFNIQEGMNGIMLMLSFIFAFIGIAYCGILLLENNE